MKVIYDFGANNGDDIPYYLKKGDLVIAVEANPKLSALIRSRFEQEIAHGRLVVINCVLDKQASDVPVPFYVHRTEDVRSQFPKPAGNELHEFESILVQSRTASSIIEKYGCPHYVKLDVEGYDQVVLEEIFSAGIRPEFISAESHNIEIFALLLTRGGYQSFKLLDGASIAREYFNHPLQTRAGTERYSFPHHSAGPFGPDIKGPWLTPNNFLYLLAYQGLGWKDIHATNSVPADASYKPTPSVGVKASLRLLGHAAIRYARNRHWYGWQKRV
jgi:FkbM family methyltransferase